MSTISCIFANMKKLQKYISFTSASIAAISASAGVVYTDVDPDVFLDNIGESYALDFNNDGTAEYTLELANGGGSYGPYIRQQVIDPAFGNQVAGYKTYSQWTSNTFANVYAGSLLITSSLSWAYGTPILGLYFNGWGGSEVRGPWENINDAFAAFKFSLSGNTHYGWARFEVGSQYTYFVLKDYAYNDTPNAPIRTGETYDESLSASQITATDVSNNHNGLDLEVSFAKANDEQKIAEYRVIAVKANKANGFGVNDANSSSYFKSVAPTGNDIVTLLKETSKDSDGDIISEDVPYKIYVLSVPDLVNSFSSNLPPSSDTIILQSSVGIEELHRPSIVFANHRLTPLDGHSIQHVSVLDMSGKVIAEVKQLPRDGIAIKGAKGVYIVHYENNGSIYSKKITL